LLVLAVAEGRPRRPRRDPVGLSVITQLAHAVAWLWRELHGQPHGPWHPCQQCGRPILEPSRAAYCSHACRSYARLERDAEALDPHVAERARRRLRARRLRGLANANPDWKEVPF